MTAIYRHDTGDFREYHQRLGMIRRWFPVTFALLYATFLTELPLDLFKDRANYFVYISYSDQILSRYTAGGLVSTVANEPLWLLLNMLLARFLSPEEAMRTIIFVPAFLVSWQLTKRDPRHALWMVAFLLSPQVVKNHIIHLRQGVALSVFVLGYFAESKAARYTLMAAACLIHSSFFFICIIGVAVWFLAIARFSPRAQVAVLLVSFATAGAFIEFFLGGLSALAGEFGARQAFTYADADLDISGIGFVFWSLIFLLFAFSQEEFVAKSAFAISILAFYLAAYFFTPVAGRIFESGMFLVFLAGLALAPVQRLAFLSAFILLACVQYYLRLGEPWLGFGIW